MSIKEHNNLKPWKLWDEDIRLRQDKAMKKYQRKFKKDIAFWVFTQYVFFSQWRDLKNYANQKR